MKLKLKELEEKIKELENIKVVEKELLNLPKLAPVKQQDDDDLENF